jgi:hypothetical protein
MKDFVWKTQRKRLLGSPRHRWEGNGITGLKEIEREGVEWIVWLRRRKSGSLLWTQ